MTTLLRIFQKSVFPFLLLTVLPTAVPDNSTKEREPGLPGPAMKSFCQLLLKVLHPELLSGLPGSPGVSAE